MKAGAYHKFVKTTPKPRATKKSNGELELPPGLFRDSVVVAEGAEDEVADIVDIGDVVDILM